MSIFQAVHMYVKNEGAVGPAGPAAVTEIVINPVRAEEVIRNLSRSSLMPTEDMAQVAQLLERLTHPESEAPKEDGDGKDVSRGR